MNDSDDERTELTPEEARVLGCLLEKEATTPDVYPLTLNGLLAACNQKTNRNPVVDYDEDAVAEAIEGLRAKGLAFRVDGAGSRVPKYRHHVHERFNLGKAGRALLTTLLLRGPQTPGELRSRSERLHHFADVEATEAELDALAAELDPPLWKKIPPAPGQKESRYLHLLCGDREPPAASGPSLAAEPAVAAVQARNERIVALETKVGELEKELAEMKAAFETFRRQFD